MKATRIPTIILTALCVTACGSTANTPNTISIEPISTKDSSEATSQSSQQLETATGQFLTTLSHDGVSVQVIIDKPTSAEADVVMTFHGTVETDDKIVQAAEKTLNATKKLISRKDILYISVAYPEANLLMGDNIKHAQAALSWVKQKASKTLKIATKKIILIGHSQGGYIVTRLNALEATDGVIANAPGPLDLKFRCELEESGKIQESGNCSRIRNKYGSTQENPDAYLERSLLSHIKNFKSRIVFTQGMSDSRIQLTSWPKLKEKVLACETCAQARFEELEGQHAALFANPTGGEIINDLLK